MKKSLDFLKGAAIGALLGSVAGILLESEKDVTKIVSNITKRIVAEAEKAKGLTKDGYEVVVDKAVDEYAKDKKIAQKILKKVSKELKAKWSEIKKEF